MAFPDRFVIREGCFVNPVLLRNPVLKDGSMFEISRTVVSMSTAGLLVIAAGIVARRRELTGGLLPDRAIGLGRVFVAASLATFGALHLASASGLTSMVPKYLPMPLFWVYLVGFALIATALSLIFDKAVRWSGLLCGCMFLMFVALMDLPAITTMLHDRFGQALFVREISFGSGLIALGVSMGPASKGKSRVVAVCRIVFGLVAVFYGVETLLHPEFLPGVPLEKITPDWEPAARLWGYAIGAFLLVCGALLLLNRWAKKAGAWLGIAIAVAVVVVYLPLLGPAHGTDQVVEAIDYIFDTLLFAGTALILVEAVGRMEPD
jgi:uncharacterized membrane protein